MRPKIVAAVLAMALMAAYFSPIVIKLKEISLSIVVLGGLVLVAIDVWETLSDRSG